MNTKVVALMIGMLLSVADGMQEERTPIYRSKNQIGNASVAKVRHHDSGHRLGCPNQKAIKSSTELTENSNQVNPEADNACQIQPLPLPEAENNDQENDIVVRVLNVICPEDPSYFDNL